MEAAFEPRTAIAVQDLQRALAMLNPYRATSTTQPFATAYLTIESAMELLCDERQHRAVLLLRHAMKVLTPAVAGGGSGVELVTRHVGNALGSLGTAAN